MIMNGPQLFFESSEMPSSPPPPPAPNVLGWLVVWLEETLGCPTTKESNPIAPKPNTDVTIIIVIDSCLVIEYVLTFKDNYSTFN